MCDYDKKKTTFIVNLVHLSLERAIDFHFFVAALVHHVELLQVLVRAWVGDERRGGCGIACLFTCWLGHAFGMTESSAKATSADSAKYHIQVLYKLTLQRFTWNENLLRLSFLFRDAFLVWCHIWCIELDSLIIWCFHFAFRRSPEAVLKVSDVFTCVWASVVIVGDRRLRYDLSDWLTACRGALRYGLFFVL